MQTASGELFSVPVVEEMSVLQDSPTPPDLIETSQANFFDLMGLSCCFSR